MRYKLVLHKFVQYSSSVLFESNLRHIKLTSRNMSTNKEELEKAKTILKNMYRAGIQAVLPKTIILSKVKIEDGKLLVGDESFELKENVYLVGFGKAVMGMSIVLEYMLGDRLKKGIVSIPSSSANAMWESEDKSYFPKLGTSVVEYREGSVNNQPDDRSYETTHDIIDLAESLTENDTLIVLISGGGSALLYMPRPAIDRDDKLQLCKTLQNAGADIKEVNVIRRKLSMVKGGGLARMAFPASVITLILSDIVGDPIDLIASGPTAYSNKDPREVLAVLKKYNLTKEIEGDVKRIVTAKETFDDGPLLGKGGGKGEGGGKGKKKGGGKGGGKGKGKGGGKDKDKGKRKVKEFIHVNNVIVGNNMVAVQAACAEAWCNRTTPIILRNDITGNVHDVSLAYAHITNLVCLTLDKTLERQEFFDRVREAPVIPLPAEKVDELYNTIENISGEGIVLIGAGEPTVVVTGKGKGGRNQELALHFSLDWLAKIKGNPRLAEYDVVMLSAGTDGQDGPTDATGAYGYAGIGPMIHDLYAQAKSLASRKIVEVETRRNAVKDRIERYHKRQRSPEICKTEQLSGFVMAKKESKPLSHASYDEEEEKEKEPDEDERMDEETLRPFILLTMEIERMLPENVINDNDSYNLYSRFLKGAELLKTGFTGTNVMDLHFIYIKKRKCDCKIDFTGNVFENSLDMHALHIDPLTIDRYKTLRVPTTFDWGQYLRRSTAHDKEKDERLNITIIDDNLLEPCCRKNRKFPTTDLLKGKKLPL